MENQQQEKIFDLFKYIKEINSLRTKISRNIDKEKWCCFLDSIPKSDDNIVLNYRDNVELKDGDTFEFPPILSIHKPEFQQCPEPDKIFKSWLNHGWDNFEIEVTVKNTISRLSLDDDTEVKAEFYSDKMRISAYDAWLVHRTKWVEKQQHIKSVREFFLDLYQVYVDLERDEDSLELMVGNGILTEDTLNEGVCYPILLKKVMIQFDAEKNTLFIIDVNCDSELYTTLFAGMDNINHSAVQSLKEELDNANFHPLDRNDTNDFLKIAIHQLCPESLFLNLGEEIPRVSGEKLFLSIRPVLFIRKKTDGLEQFIDQIIENINQTGFIPTSIGDITGGRILPQTPSATQKSFDESLGEIGGEDKSILLAKPANKEQLEIAQQIERHDAVLVQGPPGTGKTHTIANLMGHFLATGKSVLVTSSTKKALSVLKSQLPPDLQNLCVSLLDDSNIDMERSVDGITDYLARNTASELFKQMTVAQAARNEIILELGLVRKKIYTLKNSEIQSIIYEGESISPSAAAKYVHDNEEALNYIPGKVELYQPLPLSFAELSELYHSNTEITRVEEQELGSELPDPSQLIQPGKLEELLSSTQKLMNDIEKLTSELQMKGNLESDDEHLVLSSSNKAIVLEKTDEYEIQTLREYIEGFKQVDDWMIDAIVDGKRGGGARKRWNVLLDTIRKTCQFSEEIMESQFGKTVSFADNSDYSVIFETVMKMKPILEKKGKISWFKRILDSSYNRVEELVLINGKIISTGEDCTTVLQLIQLNGLRGQCASYWNELMKGRSVPEFMQLNDGVEPEIGAKKLIEPIKYYLDWYEQGYRYILYLMQKSGCKHKGLFDEGKFDSDIKEVQDTLSVITNILPSIIKLQENFLKYCLANSELVAAKQVLTEFSMGSSDVSKNMLEAFLARDTQKYKKFFSELTTLYGKYHLQNRRRFLLKRLYDIAPEWSDSIQNRIGAGGNNQVPKNIEDAWRWKQYSGILAKLIGEPFAELQIKSAALSNDYRKSTAELAVCSAWYYLLNKTESDLGMRQALQGWKQTTKKIGKGTGKNAPRYRKEAQKLMTQCQNAVPAWIMTINGVLNNLIPGKNQFDVIIIDEASQADISALPLFYLAKKIIVVGDDKQVSPMAVGVNLDKINELADMYIKDKIPNWHLFTATTSLYDIAKTIFQPLMLREHFRCVPDIIGYSNIYSYDLKIKPLRDTSDCKLLPAVVNYRTPGIRDKNKVNPIEAEYIVALLLGCIAQPEYEGKTFGVISLLGNQQAKYIEQLLVEYLQPIDLEKRRILCGDASNFQGDERDVIFLSMVDSNDGDGPLRKTGVGADDSIKKRYNVAVSRAKDQLWLVHSLDVANDLKPDDMRKSLLEYTTDPNAVNIALQQVKEQSESPFEETVASTLIANGYRIIQQWPVGAYRIDMVAEYGKERVAIECDGERWHSGEEKVRQDMERQTILERLGWRFIRIRGSEYYRHPEETMERVMRDIQHFGVQPVGQDTVAPEVQIEDLLQKVKRQAAQYIRTWSGGAE